MAITVLYMYWTTGGRVEVRRNHSRTSVSRTLQLFKYTVRSQRLMIAACNKFNLTLRLHSAAIVFHTQVTTAGEEVWE